MISSIKYIGVIDTKDKVHFVKFNSGVNVITGRSSTGKSAMIEIFDYCFGSSEFTVPSGIITDYAYIYFVVLSVESTNIVLARRPSLSTKAFLKEERTIDINTFSKSYFEDKDFIQLSDFKVELGRYFRLVIKDTDTDLEDKKYRFQNRAKGRPSIRNMTSFMLQHQNLVANKHSIFYRFDEKEKREQTIDQFKIFAGFVTQKYFIIKQKLAEEERKLKSLEKQKKDIELEKEANNKQLDGLLNEYIAITGKKLIDENPQVLLLYPNKMLGEIENLKVLSDSNSNEYLKQVNTLKSKKNQLEAEKRTLLLKMNEMGHSIRYAKEYKEHLTSLDEIENANLHLSQCPFCSASNEKIVKEANELEKAIEWLNKELANTPYMLDSFESEHKELELKIKEISVQILDIDEDINKIYKIIEQLDNNKSLEEQGLKIKLKIENLLESLINKNDEKIDENMLKASTEITRLKNILKEEFDVDGKVKSAQKYIDTVMQKIGKEFEFEESYQPINLKFSLDSFELWHQKSPKEKIYLRSMGSGANWLYSHITLFLAIHKYFCSLGDKSLIPPILFFDQPSQVYFPTSIQDNGDSFNAEAIKEKVGGQTTIDEDLKAVTNLFNQMVKFCDNTLKETGIKPQIIITDHADNLLLEGNIDFDSLVNGRRWRKRGFINIKSF